jgi:O-succinylbenzoic acid--CoA ligase
VQSHDRVEFVGPTQFTWLGRADFTINSGGIKLQPEVLESELGPLLHQFGYTAEYYVIGREDVALGQKVVLVLLASSVNIEELRTYLAKNLPAYHAPRAVEVVSAFTRTATGKIIRK